MIGVPRLEVPSELARRADDLGRRLAEHRRYAVHRNNLRTTQEKNVAMHVLGKRGEAAFYHWCGGDEGGEAEWDQTVRVRGEQLPDVIFRGKKYDTKGVDCDDLSLCVYPEGVHEDWRYVVVGCEFWPKAKLLGWCRGEDLLATPLREKKWGRPAHFIEQGDLLLRSCDEIRPELPASEPLGYILQDREGDYVLEVEDTGWETVKAHFVFTKERARAKVFSYDALYSKQATNPIGIQFMCGFGGSRAILLGEGE